MLVSNVLRYLPVAALVCIGALVACSSDDSGPATGTAGSGANSGGTVCQQACNKFENECKAGTCSVTGTCDGKAKDWSDCINSKTCAQKDDCTAILLGGNGGSAGAGGGGGGTVCETLANKCSACGSNYQMMTQCGQTAGAKDETACQTMLDDAAFKAACP